MTRITRGVVTSGAIALALAALVGAQAPPSYDLVIRGGRVLDGAGNPWVLADVAIRQDEIAAIGPGLTGKAASRDRRQRPRGVARLHRHPHARAARHLRRADGRQLRAPGRHDDLRRTGRQFAAAARGRSWSELAAHEDLAELRHVRRPGVGARGGDRHGQPQGHAGRDRAMRSSCASGMRDGAFGLSTGLFYVPGIFTPTEEVIELAKVAGEMGGIHVSHMRNEAAGVLDSVQRDDRHRRAGRAADPDHPPQDHRHRSNWGRSVDTPGARGRGARPRRGRHDRPVPVHGVEHGPHGAPAAVGARGPAGRGRQAAEGRRPSARGSSRPSSSH